jgi:hypothetical protein
MWDLKMNTEVVYTSNDDNALNTILMIKKISRTWCENKKWTLRFFIMNTEIAHYEHWNCSLWALKWFTINTEIVQTPDDDSA